MKKYRLISTYVLHPDQTVSQRQEIRTPDGILVCQRDSLAGLWKAGNPAVPDVARIQTWVNTRLSSFAVASPLAAAAIARSRPGDKIEISSTTVFVVAPRATYAHTTDLLITTSSGVPNPTSGSVRISGRKGVAKWTHDASGSSMSIVRALLGGRLPRLIGEAVQTDHR